MIRVYWILTALFCLLNGWIEASEPCIASNRSNDVIAINTAGTSLIYSVNEGRLVFQYYGKRLGDSSAFRSRKFPTLYTTRDFSYDAFPAFGGGNINEPALSVIYGDGSVTTDLKYLGFQQTNVSQNIAKTIIRLKDNVKDLKVDLHLEVFKAEDVITQWVEITNGENTPVTLKNVYSAFLNIKAIGYYLTHFHGAWANEMTLTEEKLEPGIKAIESKKGVRTTQSDNSAFILSMDHPSLENEGECIGGALAWSGNYKMSFQVDEQGTVNILGGINPFMSDYKLETGKSFETPKMVYSYSAEGRGQVSRNLHDWARNYNLHHGTTPRPIVLNSWEGAYFSFDENVITEMIDGAASFGVEMFVLDDGWFGNEYPRDNPRAGLGDWQTNLKKLPRGLDYLVDYANSKGVGFGLWIEPEMVNPESVLAKKHPEWIVQSPGHEKLTLRNQLLLDLSNPKVQQFVWNTVDSILTAHSEIAYLKWDANRHVENVGSSYLPADKQTHFWIEYTRGLYWVYEKIRAKYPDVILQACSSGGGRLDFGSLKYHDEFWTSDDTDPLKRLYIQYGTNLIYPPVATAAHVSTSPNHQTGTMTPLKFRFDVAMTGRLGMELQPKDLKGQDSLFAMNAIKEYKKIRPLIAAGDLYRFNSPYEDDGWISLMYVSKTKESSVLFAFSTKLHNRGQFLNVKLRGLDPSKTYLIKEINAIDERVFWGDQMTFTGDYLINVGVDLNLTKPCESAVFEITEVM
ncbi:alpha-galactosidase [uncultured Draconibacterium sp.]|uniref:alpha-galactosidase n=1 Tax=uncultured Draconibacterium sp. TaxID=1573823 RepID=UPI0029C91494|nr:alpha-galactosidase [uncultured Draconibacterium sp.]